MRRRLTVIASFVLVWGVIAAAPAAAASLAVEDLDGDLVADDVDNCPMTANPFQIDSDGDGVGDLCEPDGPIPGDSDDVIVGTAGDDALFGGGGHDSIDGLAGDDFIVGGPGDDLLTGGPGCDVFALDPTASETDTIVDFEPGRDRLVFAQPSIDGFGDRDPDVVFEEGEDGSTGTFEGGLKVVFLGQAEVEVDTSPCDPSPAPAPPPNTAPTISGPSSLTVEGTSSAGADVDFGVTGSDAEDGSLAASCSPGNPISFGTTSVTCTVTDSGGLSASLSLTVEVTCPAAGLTHTGTDGDDLFTGSVCNDRFEGGAGTDTVAMMSTDPLLNTLTEGSIVFDDWNSDGIDDGIDTLIDIEVMTFGPDIGPLDVMEGSSADDDFSGDDDDDYMIGHGGNDTLDGGEGTDVIKGGDGEDKIYGDSENDRSTPGNDDFVGGSAHHDKVYGDAGGTLTASGGDDTVRGGGSFDWLYGDATTLQDATGGVDTVVGGPGDDHMYGDAYTVTGSSAVGGDDDLYGGTGNDTIYGDGYHLQNGAQGGDDHLYAEDGDSSAVTDVLYGDARELQQTSSGGDDVITGGPDGDTIYGDAWDIMDTASGGDDTIDGGGGDDTIYGDAFKLTGSGVSGDDTIDGGAGNDTIYGDAEVLNGTAAGADTFVYHADGTDNGDDTVWFFDMGTDQIEIRGVADYNGDSAITGSDLDHATSPHSLTSPSGDTKIWFGSAAGSDGSVLVDNLLYQSGANGTFELLETNGHLTVTG